MKRCSKCGKVKPLEDYYADAIAGGVPEVPK